MAYFPLEFRQVVVYSSYLWSDWDVAAANCWHGNQTSEQSFKGMEDESGESGESLKVATNVFLRDCKQRSLRARRIRGRRRRRNKKEGKVSLIVIVLGASFTPKGTLFFFFISSIYIHSCLTNWLGQTFMHVAATDTDIYSCIGRMMRYDKDLGWELSAMKKRCFTEYVCESMCVCVWEREGEKEIDLNSNMVKKGKEWGGKIRGRRRRGWIKSVGKMKQVCWLWFPAVKSLTSFLSFRSALLFSYFVVNLGFISSGPGAF